MLTAICAITESEEEQFNMKPRAGEHDIWVLVTLFI